MKINKGIVALGAVVCIGFVFLLHARPSLSRARAARTIADLKKVVAGGGGDFFVDLGNRAASPRAAGMVLNEAATVLLKSASDRISQLKAAIDLPQYARLSSAAKSKARALVESYADYLLYFDYGGKRVYINDPYPQMNISPNGSIPALNSIMRKWNK